MARKMNPEKPGVMLYFDVIDSMRELSGDECKELIVALEDYGKDGKEPDFKDNKALKSLWPVIRSGLNRDNERYVAVRSSRKYGAYCKAMKSNRPVRKPCKERQNAV